MEPKYYGAAASYNKPAGGAPLSRKLLMITGLVLGVIILLVVALSVFSAINQGPQNELSRLTARQGALAILLEEQQEHIKSGDLRAANATALILAKSDTTALTAHLQTAFGLKEVPPNITALETDPETAAQLETALLTGTFDHAYIGIVREKIASTYALAQTIYNGASNAGLQAILERQLESLTAIEEQLEELEL